jgi:parvulin-like peptidyl-prolyl cis-trans isomerase-like protein
MRLVIICAVVAAGAIGGFLVGRASVRGGSPGSTGPVVVSFRGGELHGGDLTASLEASPEPMRAQLATREGRRALVDGLVRMELLAAKADEKGYDRDPGFMRRKKQELGALYLAKEFEEGEKSRAPTDDEVRKFFEDHRAERSHPDRVRVAMMAFLSEDSATRPQKRALAQAALAEVHRRSKDYYAFGKIARLRSEEPRSRAANGELPPLGRDELATRFGREVADAAFAMDKPEVYRQVIESPRGFFVVQLLSKVPAYEPKLDDVKDAIRAKLTNDRREADLKAFMDRLWKEANVKVDEDALERLSL